MKIDVSITYTETASILAALTQVGNAWSISVRNAILAAQCSFKDQKLPPSNLICNSVFESFNTAVLLYSTLETTKVYAELNGRVFINNLDQKPISLVATMTSY